VDEPVDRPVLGRDPEQQRDPDQDHEQVAREAGEDVVLRHPQRGADAERGHDAEHPHVDPHRGGDEEHHHQHEDRDQLVGHACLPPVG
jgi:hypothetical protein